MNLKRTYITLCIAAATVTTSFVLAQDRPQADDPRELLAIVYKLHGQIAAPTWMQIQDYDVAHCKAGKVLVAGIFQDGSHEAITILQRMHRSEAEQIMNNDPAVKAGLCTATLRRFSAYAPLLGTATKRNEG